MTRAERKQATRAALIDAGERLVRKKGFGVSVDEIAAEAGFTKGAVYSNFAGRAELMYDVAERVVPGLQIAPDHTLPTLADTLEDGARQQIAALAEQREQIVLTLDMIAQMLRDDELRDALLQETRESREAAAAKLPWPIPIPGAQWIVAVNAVAVGMMAHRLLFGEEQVPDELFVWVNRRLAGD